MQRATLNSLEEKREGHKKKKGGLDQNFFKM